MGGKKEIRQRGFGDQAPQLASDYFFERVSARNFSFNQSPFFGFDIISARVLSHVNGVALAPAKVNNQNDVSVFDEKQR